MPDVCVVVPWRGGCEHRQRAWDWVRDRYRDRHPGWQVVEAPGPDPWVKAMAVMPVISATSADVVVVADADVWTDQLVQAVQAVAAGEPWAIPHLTVHRLSEAGTAALLAGIAPAGQELAEHPYQGVQGGGIVVASRTVLQAVPLDPRFVGWGSEDESWAMALHFTVGPAWRGTAPLFHLWHPPQPRLSRRRGSAESWQLRRRYVQARNDPRAMRHLLTEAADALSAAQPALHHHAA